MRTVKHSPTCPWRYGGECLCGGNPRVVVASPLSICPVCTNDPCGCAPRTDVVGETPKEVR